MDLSLSDSEGGSDTDQSVRPTAGRGDADGHSSTVEQLNALLKLPLLPATNPQALERSEPLVDYFKSILITSEQYVVTMQLRPSGRRKQS